MFLLLLVAFAATPATALAADPTPPAPVLGGSTTNPNPAPAIELRLLDAAGIFSSGEVAELSAKIERIWRGQNLDVLVATRVAPDRGSVEQTEEDAKNIGNNARVGIGARGGLVVLFNLDESKCHGQAQIYADDRLRAVASNADRQTLFDVFMKPKLKDCDIYGATNIAIDDTTAIANGDRSVLPAAIDWSFWIVVIPLALVVLFLAILVIGRFAAFPDARRRYHDMMDRYQEGVDDPDVDTSNDDDFIYGGGRSRRRRKRGRSGWSNPDWSDPGAYPVYYGRPPGFWGWWFGVGSHTTNVPSGSSSGGSWGSTGGRSGGSNWGSAGLAAGGFWSGIGHDAGAVLGGVGEVLEGLADASSSGGGGGFSGGGGAGGGF